MCSARMLAPADVPPTTAPRSYAARDRRTERGAGDEGAELELVAAGHEHRVHLGQRLHQVRVGGLGAAGRTQRDHLGGPEGGEHGAVELDHLGSEGGGAGHDGDPASRAAGGGDEGPQHRTPAHLRLGAADGEEGSAHASSSLALVARVPSGAALDCELASSLTGDRPRSRSRTARRRRRRGPGAAPGSRVSASQAEIAGAIGLQRQGAGLEQPEGPVDPGLLPGTQPGGGRQPHRSGRPDPGGHLQPAQRLRGGDHRLAQGTVGLGRAGRRGRRLGRPHPPLDGRTDPMGDQRETGSAGHHDLADGQRVRGQGRRSAQRCRGARAPAGRAPTCRSPGRRPPAARRPAERPRPRPGPAGPRGRPHGAPRRRPAPRRPPRRPSTAC